MSDDLERRLHIDGLGRRTGGALPDRPMSGKPEEQQGMAWLAAGFTAVELTPRPDP